ncbi:Futalosine hydrolase OS=Streptomyces griseomycini OX=66895 GN=mqnB PE=3 SV=1 [Streptomyces griseomycini]
MVLPAEEGRGLLTRSAPRVLVATAVPVERDAVAQAFAGPPLEVPLPGATLLRAPVGPDVLAAGVGPALAAAATATALTAAALDGRPYDLVVSAGIAGGFPPDAPGSLVVADEITAADLGAETADGFLPVPVASAPSPTVRRPAWSGTPPRRPARSPAPCHPTVTGTAARPPGSRARRPRALAEAGGLGAPRPPPRTGCPCCRCGRVDPVGPRTAPPALGAPWPPSRASGSPPSWRVGAAVITWRRGCRSPAPPARTTLRLEAPPTAASPASPPSTYLPDIDVTNALAERGERACRRRS